MKIYLIYVATLASYSITNGEPLADVVSNVIRLAGDTQLPVDTSIKQTVKMIDEKAMALQLTPRDINNEIERLINYYQVVYNLKVNIFYIESMYEKLQSHAANYENETLMNFAESCTSHKKEAIPNILNVIYNLAVFPIKNHLNLFELLMQPVETEEDKAAQCGRNKSNQQEIYILYNFVMMYMLKGYVLMLQSYLIMGKLGEGSYDAEINATAVKAIDDMTNIGDVVSNVLKMASRDVRPCDPTTDKEDETYTQLKWLFTATAIHNFYLNNGNGCTACENIRSTTIVPSSYNYGDHQCNGEITFCFYQDLSPNYCAATQPYRRYNGFPKWINGIWPSLPARGNVENCVYKHIVDLTGGRSFENRLPGLGGCSMCICYCDALLDSNTVRAFSLRVAEARTNENRVVTGVRIVEKYRIFHIQIQDGILESNGVIKSSTLEWVPIENLHFDPRNHSMDYYVIDHYNNHIFFDNLVVPSGRALTGLAFRGDGQCCGLKIKIEHAAVDIAAGKVQTGTKQWLLNDVAREDSDEIKLTAPHIPTLGKSENVVHLNEHAYTRFRQTDWNKDAAQIAIPFIDIQPVILDPPALLSGAGLYYKGQEGYGGFIGLKLVTYDHDEFIPKRRPQSNIHH